MCNNCEACGITLNESTQHGLCDQCERDISAEVGSNDFPEYPEDNFTDAEADADTLASAGMGMHEDYGYFGDEY